MKLAEKILKKLSNEDTNEDMGSNDFMRIKIAGDYYVGLNTGFDISKRRNCNPCEREDFETVDDPQLEASVKNVISAHKTEFLNKVVASLKQMKV